MARSDLEVEIRGKDRLSRETKKAERGVKGLGDAIKALGTLIVSSRAFSFFVDSITAAEQATFRLTNALRNTQQQTALSNDEWEAWANSVQAATVASADQAKELAALAVTLTGSADEAQRVAEAALDIAAAQGVDARQAAINLGRAYSGQLGELSELIPATKELTVEQLRSGEATRLAARAFENAAEIQGRTLAGAATRATNATQAYIAAQSEAEGLTGDLRDGLNATADALTSQAEAAAQAENANTGFYASARVGVTVVRDVIVAVNRWIQGLIGVEEELEDLGETIGRNTELIEANRRATERTNRINAEWAKELKDVRAFAASLGITLEQDLERAIDNNEAALIRADEAYQRGIITRRDFERIQAELAESNDKLSEKIELNTSIAEEQRRQTEEAASRFDELAFSIDGAAASQDRFATATERATAAQAAQQQFSGGEGSTILTGTERTTGFTLGGGTFSVPARTVSTQNQPTNQNRFGGAP